MIMPCINSTSACESGRSAAFVEGGSVLLGLPGAPGCTTTGLVESFCCAATAQDNRPARPRNTTRRRNGVVTFTTGLQDRTRTMAIAMLAQNTKRCAFEDGKRSAAARSSCPAYAEWHASRGIMGADFGGATALHCRAPCAFPVHWS